jgi:uncharacterized integral membrane protein (TIGR00698 family)
VIPFDALGLPLPRPSGGLALCAGAALGLLLGNPYAAKTRKLAQWALQLSVVGLGFGMDLRVVMRAGLHGMGWTIAGIAGCLALGALLARTLRVAGRTGMLISVGTAICGGSAIAALAPVVRADEDEIAVALATVFLLNAAALLIFPPIGHAVHLSQAQFGLWAALAIHDTSSVVAAAMSYGAQALEIATTVKLARALWIVPLTLLAGVWMARRERTQARETALGAGLRTKPARPWFIAGFIAAAALVTFLPTLKPIGQSIRLGAQQTLVATLFLIGTGLSAGALRRVGIRPLALGVLLWIAVGTISLAAIFLST